MEVVWSKRSNEELRKAFEYISLDSPQNATKVVNDIFDLAINLAHHPEKYNPDKYKRNNDNTWRAFEVHRFRVSYRVMPSQIRIIRIRHTSRTPLQY